MMKTQEPSTLKPTLKPNSKPNLKPTSKTDELFHIENLTVKAGSKEILSVPKLTLYRQQLTTFIGPNGAGKSTLLHCLLNQNMSSSLNTSGLISTNLPNQSNNNKKSTDGKIAWVGQHERFQLPLNVIEYALLGVSPHLAWYQTANSQQIKHAHELLNIFELDHLQHRRVQTLSGGEKQRLAVVRALMQNTEVIMLDEPTNHLDIRHQRFLLSYLHQLVSEQHKSIVLVLHDLTHAYKYSDQVLLMSDGKVIAQGLPQHVMTQEQLSPVYHTDIVTYDTESGRLFAT